MKLRTKKAVLILFLGDLVAFVAGLWLALVVRARGAVSTETFLQHLTPFLFIFAVWVLVFFIADLYRRPTSIFRRRLPTTIFNALLANSIIAVLFFYLIPYFGITPKTILFIDLILTFGLVYLWRRYLVKRFWRGRSERVLFACEGPEVDEVIAELKNNSDYNITVLEATDGDDLKSKQASIIVINPHERTTAESLRDLYQMLMTGTRFVNIHTLYEDLFDRIPLSLINEQWFLENVSNHPKTLYTFTKRAMDITAALLLGIIPLLLIPIVWVLMRFFDPGRLFSYQSRVGQHGRLVRIAKFRTMTIADDGGKWGGDNHNKVTSLGKVLRRWRVDEWPQLWNVLRGDVSLIGPRLEFPDPVKRYSSEVPFYSFRHIIKPGLSGWAQIYHKEAPRHDDPDAVRKTTGKLSYDLYYIKNRNLWVDIKIALNTIKTLISREGE